MTKSCIHSKDPFLPKLIIQILDFLAKPNKKQRDQKRKKEI